MSAQMKIAVAGGTGRLGRHVVEILEDEGHDVVVMSRSTGVDVVTGEGLAEALAGVDVIIDAATGPSPDQQAATEFFAASAANLQEAGMRAGVSRIVVVSIIGIGRFAGGYNAAKVVQEHAMLRGPVPVRIVRAAQFHEFVGQILDWSRRGEVAYLPEMRTQLVAARAAAEVVARVAVDPAAPLMTEVAGPRAEHLADVARLLIAHRGEAVLVETVTDSSDPDQRLYAEGALLPGPDAVLAGPTFEDWLGVTVP